MKYSRSVTSSSRKQRKAHFSAPSNKRRIIMSASLAKDLRKKHGVRSMPVRKNDEVKVVRGTHKDHTGLVTACYRKKWVIHIDKLQRDKENGQTALIGIDPSNVVITKLDLSDAKGQRKSILERKDKNKAAAANKGKIAQSEVTVE